MTKTRKNINIHNKTRKRIFTKKDYNAGDGMMVKIWGPLQWTFLHTMSFNYPVHPTIEDKKHYRDYVLNLQYVLPCKYCRMNLANNFKKKPLQMCHMENRETFSRYIYELHELVNKMLKKKSHLTYCQVRERYEHFRSRCTEEKPKIFKFENQNQLQVYFVDHVFDKADLIDDYGNINIWKITFDGLPEDVVKNIENLLGGKYKKQNKKRKKTKKNKKNKKTKKRKKLVI